MRPLHTPESSGNAAEPAEVAKAVSIAMESVPVPPSFLCPISHEIMTDPVVTHDGQVYDRDSINAWFRRGHNTSPLTGVQLPNLIVTPETPLRRAIEEYLSARPEIVRSQLDLLSFQEAAVTLEADLKAKQHLSTNPQEPAGDYHPAASFQDLLNAIKANDNLQCIQKILSCSTHDINRVDNQGYNVLHHAASRGLLLVCFAILDHPGFTQESVTKEASDAWNSTAVELAVQNSYYRLAAALNAYVAFEQAPDTIGNSGDARGKGQGDEVTKGEGKGKDHAGARGKAKGKDQGGDEGHGREKGEGKGGQGGPGKGQGKDKGKGKGKGNGKGKSKECIQQGGDHHDHASDVANFPNPTVHVANLPNDTRRRDLLNWFQRYGEVRGVLCRKSSVSECLVQFESAFSASAAIADHVLDWYMRGSGPLRVSYASPSMLDSDEFIPDTFLIEKVTSYGSWNTSHYINFWLS